MTPDLARRHALLTAALGFALLRTRDGSAPPETEMVRRWLGNWRGLGDVVTGMNRQGYMLHLANVDASTWRATFGRDPMLSSDGFGTGPTPWRAVQVAAWQALGKTPREPPHLRLRQTSSCPERAPTPVLAQRWSLCCNNAPCLA